MVSKKKQSSKSLDGNTPAQKVELYKVSHSKMSSYRRCLQRYQWQYVEKFFPPSAKGQVRGIAGHAGLAEWHRNYDEKRAMDIAQIEYEKQNGVLDDEWATLQITLERYFAWSKVNDTFRIIQSEQEFNLHFDLGGAKDFLLNGFIDGVVKDGKFLWLLENKFYKKIDNSPLDLDPQVSVYMLAAHLLGIKVEGVIYNIIRVAGTKISETEPVIRRKLSRPITGLELTQAEIINQVSSMRMFEEGALPVYRNATKDCHWDCPFWLPCLSMAQDGTKPTKMLHQIAHTKGVE